MLCSSTWEESVIPGSSCVVLMALIMEFLLLGLVFMSILCSTGLCHTGSSRTPGDHLGENKGTTGIVVNFNLRNISYKYIDAMVVGHERAMRISTKKANFLGWCLNKLCIIIWLTLSQKHFSNLHCFTIVLHSENKKP